MKQRTSTDSIFAKQGERNGRFSQMDDCPTRSNPAFGIGRGTGSHSDIAASTDGDSGSPGPTNTGPGAGGNHFAAETDEHSRALPPGRDQLCSGIYQCNHDHADSESANANSTRGRCDDN